MQMLFKVCCILMRNVEEAKVCWRDGSGPWAVGRGRLSVYHIGSMYLELSLVLPPILQMMKLRSRKGKGLV